MLTLFHALGKLLYNKRADGSSPPAQQQQQQQQQPQQHAEGNRSGAGSPPASQQQQHRWTANGLWHGGSSEAHAPQAPLAVWARRRPMQFDPEAVLAGASLEAGAWGATHPLLRTGSSAPASCLRAPCAPCPSPARAPLRVGAGSVAAFLQENLLDFVSEGHIEDTAACLEHLSVSDVLASNRLWGSECWARGRVAGH